MSYVVHIYDGPFLIQTKHVSSLSIALLWAQYRTQLQALSLYNDFKIRAQVLEIAADGGTRLVDTLGV